jgi:hypothetical protein
VNGFGEKMSEQTDADRCVSVIMHLLFALLESNLCLCLGIVFFLYVNQLLCEIVNVDGAREGVCQIDGCFAPVTNLRLGDRTINSAGQQDAVRYHPYFLQRINWICHPFHYFHFGAG